VRVRLRKKLVCILVYPAVDARMERRQRVAVRTDWIAPESCLITYADRSLITDSRVICNMCIKDREREREGGEGRARD